MIKFWDKIFLYKLTHISIKTYLNINFIKDLQLLKNCLKAKKLRNKTKRFLARTKNISIKKKSTNINFFFKLNFYFNSPLLLNPSFNTFLSLYSINSQKFIEELKSFKNLYSDNVLFNLYLFINKDGTFYLSLGSLKFNFFIQSIDLYSTFYTIILNYSKVNIISENTTNKVMNTKTDLFNFTFFENFLFLHKFFFVSGLFEFESILIKNYSIYDLWFFIFILNQFSFFLDFNYLFFVKNLDIYLKTLYSNFFTLYRSLKLKTILYVLK